MSAFEAQGFSVALDRPFSGSMVPQRYYRQDSNVHSFMVEVNRALYMDEGSGKKNEAFHLVQERIQSALSAIGLFQTKNAPDSLQIHCKNAPLERSECIQ